MKTTIRDIARTCGVSTSTVSGVLHNRSNVKQETRERILKTIRKLKYDPLANIPLARRTRSGRIGIIIPFSEAGAARFYQRAVLALKAAATERDFDCIIYSADDIKRKTTAGYHLGRGNFDCDALIVYCPFSTTDWQGWLRTLHAWDIPLALIRRHSGLPGVIEIGNNDEAGLRLALDHLHAQGHTRIALLCRHRTHPFMAEHEQTYRAFLADNGLPYIPELVGGLFDAAAGTPGTREIITEWWRSLEQNGTVPTACVCRNDPLALRLAMRLSQLGVRVPEDLALVGFDDDFEEENSPLPLSSVRIPVEEMVTMAVTLLAERMKGNNTGGAVIDVPLELKIRESSRYNA